MHNRFEVKHLKLEHFYVTAQKEKDSEILNKIRDYLNLNLEKTANSVIKSYAFGEKGKVIYMFEFQWKVSLSDLTVILEKMFENDEWTICRTYHNLTTDLFVVETL